MKKGLLLRDALDTRPLVSTSFDCWNPECAEGSTPEWDDSISVLTAQSLMRNMADKFQIAEMDGVADQYLERGRDPKGFGAALRDMAAVLVAHGYAVRLDADGFDVYEMKDVPADVEDVMRKLSHGWSLEIEPEDVEPVELTYFDCWSPTGDEDSDPYPWDSEDAIKMCFDVLTSWSRTLNLPELNPLRMYGVPASQPVEAGCVPNSFRAEYLARGQSQVFADARNICVHAGYSVYDSDTRIEIYHTIDLDPESDTMVDVFDSLPQVPKFRPV